MYTTLPRSIVGINNLCVIGNGADMCIDVFSFHVAMKLRSSIKYSNDKLLLLMIPFGIFEFYFESRC